MGLNVSSVNSSAPALLERVQEVINNTSKSSLVQTLLAHGGEQANQSIPIAQKIIANSPDIFKNIIKAIGFWIPRRISVLGLHISSAAAFLGVSIFACEIICQVGNFLVTPRIRQSLEKQLNIWRQLAGVTGIEHQGEKRGLSRKILAWVPFVKPENDQPKPLPISKELNTTLKKLEQEEKGLHTWESRLAICRKTQIIAIALYAVLILGDQVELSLVE